MKNQKKPKNFSRFQVNLKPMLKLINSKRGINDTSLMYGIILLFVLLGVLMPYINSSFNASENEFNTGDLSTDYDGDGTVTSVTFLSLIGSVAKMFFWTFGALPFWLDAIFLVFRVILGVIIFKTVRSGGN